VAVLLGFSVAPDVSRVKLAEPMFAMYMTRPTAAAAPAVGVGTVRVWLAVDWLIVNEV